MIGADFYRLVTELLEPGLAERGWQVIDRALYSQQCADGVARCALDPGRRFERFRVMIGFDPPDIVALLDSLFGDELSPSNNRGFLTPPYLTPAGVFRRHSGFGCRTRQQMAAAATQVLRAMDAHAQPWLAQLRDPQVFASLADPVAALVTGYAWERAGHPDRAREFYEEMWRRLEGGLVGLTPAKLQRIEVSTKRMYLFVADRLGRHDAVCAVFERDLGRAAG